MRTQPPSARAILSKASIVKDQSGLPSGAARNQPSRTAGPISTRFGVAEFGKDEGGVTRRGVPPVPPGVFPRQLFHW